MAKSNLVSELTKLTKQKTIPAIVVDIGGSFCSVKLSDRGKILHGLRFMGNAPSMGDKVFVNYQSGAPVVYTYGENVLATITKEIAAIPPLDTSTGGNEGSNTGEHNELTGLQGGLPAEPGVNAEYYHLTEDEYDGLTGGSLGDMFKSTYDADDNGIVDDTDAIGGAAVENPLGPTTGQTIQWDGSKFVATDSSGGGIEFSIDGRLDIISNACNAYVFTAPSSISSWYVYLKSLGSVGSSIFDIHLFNNTYPNGVTIFTTQANRPTVAYNDVNGWAVAVPDITSFVAGDVLTFDIDQIATGAADVVCVGGSVGSGGTPTQSYEKVALAADNSVTTIEDVGLSITRTLENAIWYRWKFAFVGTKTTTGTLYVVITDESNNVKELRYWSASNTYGISGFIEFPEQGTGVEVTRKIRAYCNTGSFNFDMDANWSIIFSVEKCN